MCVVWGLTFPVSNDTVTSDCGEILNTNGVDDVPLMNDAKTAVSHVSIKYLQCIMSAMFNSSKCTIIKINSMATNRVFLKKLIYNKTLE